MGRRAVVTKEQVYEVAAALLAEGGKVTVKAIQERTGGSFTTITPYLSDWRKDHAAQVPANAPDIPEALQAAFAQIWAMASRSAQEELETQRQALDAARREMEQEKAEMAQEIERLEGALEAAEDKAEALETALSAEQKAKEERERQREELRIENARLAQEVQDARARGDELKGQLERLEDKVAAAAKPAPAKRPTRSRAKPKPETGAGDSTPEG